MYKHFKPIASNVNAQVEQHQHQHFQSVWLMSLADFNQLSSGHSVTANVIFILFSNKKI